MMLYHLSSLFLVIMTILTTTRCWSFYTSGPLHDALLRNKNQQINICRHFLATNGNNEDSFSLSPRLGKDQKVVSSSSSSTMAAQAISTHKSSSCYSDDDYPPSQYVIDKEGRKWRLCVAAAVLNDRQQLLIGERIRTATRSNKNDTSNNASTTALSSSSSSSCSNWQCPQGGVDVGESITQAAIRELYEEMGLQINQHVVLLQTFENIDDEASTHHVPAAWRYPSTGTNGWMEQAGFAGQELHWRIFRCIDPQGMTNPKVMCNLSGLNGENAEFQNVKWADLGDVVHQVWEKKQKPYQALRDFLLQSNHNFTNNG